MKRRKPWMWLSFALLAVLIIILLLCGPCGPCRDGSTGSGGSATTTEPSSGAEVEPAEEPLPEVSGRSRESSRPLRRRVDDSTAQRRVAPATGDAEVNGSSSNTTDTTGEKADPVKGDASPVEEKADPAKHDASPAETRPRPEPEPLTPEEYDFRTRLEIITDPSK
ncbi:MAG: hypothetical protein JW838_03290 [Spirochaetes bacterium]|nr:hypothetical protein [Spirochaetota bacterium]